MKKSLICVALLLCISAGLTAQFIYNPSDTPSTGGANSWPFNLYTGWRFQFIIDQKVLGTCPLTITDIAFAPSSTRTWGTTVTKFEMRMGHTTYKDFGTAGTTLFDKILGPSPTVVYPAGTISWPCTSGVWSDIGLKAPFVYNGSGNICVEVRYLATASAGLSTRTDASIARAYTHARYSANPFTEPNWESPIPGEMMGPKHRLTLMKGLTVVPDPAVSIGNTAQILLSNGNPGHFYQLAASLGNTPLPLAPCYTVNLTPDGVFMASILIGPPIFYYYAGTLSKSGTSGAKLAMPMIKALVGLKVYHAAVSYTKSLTGASNTGETLINK